MFVRYISLEGKALRFMQCVYFPGKSIHQSEAWGGEAYGMFRGQLEEGDVGIRKLAILLLLDWEYFPCVGRECD